MEITSENTAYEPPARGDSRFGVKVLGEAACLLSVVG
jgi:hypothetical protein